MGYATAQTTVRLLMPPVILFIPWYNEGLLCLRSLHDNQLQEGVQAIADDQAGCLSRKLGCW
jgi:hypothetical protein